jgi:hypothetical protein
LGFSRGKRVTAKAKPEQAKPPDPNEYPKWVKGVVVDNAQQEAKVRDGSAVFSEVVSAEGTVRKVE